MINSHLSSFGYRLDECWACGFRFFSLKQCFVASFLVYSQGPPAANGLNSGNSSLFELIRDEVAFEHAPDSQTHRKAVQSQP